MYKCSIISIIPTNIYVLVFQVSEKNWNDVKYMHLHVAFETAELYLKMYFLCSYPKLAEYHLLALGLVARILSGGNSVPRG